MKKDVNLDFPAGLSSEVEAWSGDFADVGVSFHKLKNLSTPFSVIAGPGDKRGTSTKLIIDARIYI